MGMTEYRLLVDGVDLCDRFGLIITGDDWDTRPPRDIDKISIPGRNGDLSLDNKRYKNVTMTINTVLSNDYIDTVTALANFLASTTPSTYHRLEYTAYPDEYRCGMVKQGISPEHIALRSAGRIDIVFDCKPQRYLHSGEQPVGDGEIGEGEQSITIYNDTYETWRPLIKVIGSGSFSFGGRTITVNGHGCEYVMIDTELMDCYCGEFNLNRYVQMDEMPLLPPGETVVTYNLSEIAVSLITRAWRV